VFVKSFFPIIGFGIDFKVGNAILVKLKQHQKAKLMALFSLETTPGNKHG